MPRPPRIDFPDAVYHITSRGNGRADIFFRDEDRERFLAQLAHHLRQCAVVLYAFVLTDNHIHLLLRTPRANLSRFMQRLLSSYRWSSYGGYASAAKALEFVTYDVLKEYGSDLSAARRHYRAYVQACLLENDRPLLEAMAASRYAVGDPAFVQRTEERIDKRRSGRVQDRDLDLPRWSVSLDEVDTEVAKHFRMDAGMLSAHGRRVGPAKGVAVELAARLADLSSREIGQHYGIGATAIAANHSRLASRPDVLQIVEKLSVQLWKRKGK